MKTKLSTYVFFFIRTSMKIISCVYDLNMHDVRFEVFFLFFRTYLTASDCVQIIYRQKWLCAHCATKKKWLQHVSCVTRKDEEEREKEKSVEKRNTYIHGKSGREKSKRTRNEQVEEMLKPCARMQCGNRYVLYVQRLRFGMLGVVRYAYVCILYDSLFFLQK